MTTSKLSDRELDAVIAEKVMGYTVELWWCFDGPDGLEPTDDNRLDGDFFCYNEPTRVYPHEITGKPEREIIPEYSSSLDALAPVVKKTIDRHGAAAYYDELELTTGALLSSCADLQKELILTASPRQIAEAVVRCWE